MLNWAEHWADPPKGADVTDWRDKAGGNIEKLFSIVDELPEWVPQPDQDPPAPLIMTSGAGPPSDKPQQQSPKIKIIATPYRWPGPGEDPAKAIHLRQAFTAVRLIVEEIQLVRGYRN